MPTSRWQNRGFRRTTALAAAAVLAGLTFAPGAATAGEPAAPTVASLIAAQRPVYDALGLSRRPGVTADDAIGGSGLGDLVGVGDDHTCVAAVLQSVWCWGAGDRGQLGAGTTTDSAHPVLASRTGGLAGKIVISVGAGRAHSCAAAFGFTDSNVYCWGDNSHGQLGDGSTTARTRPVKIAGTDARKVVTGADHSCVLNGSGEVSCWGRDDNGQLGIGAGALGTDVTTPHRVTGLPLIIDLAAGDDDTCALDSAGHAWCWGSDAHGELGNGGGASGTPAPAPVAVDRSTVSGRLVQLSVGHRHACAVNAANTAYCWGDDTAGQLGNGSSAADHSKPGPVAGRHAFISVSAGGDSTCAGTDRGAEFCWGGNSAGQLGTGDHTARTAPAAADLSGVPASTLVRLLGGPDRPLVLGVSTGSGHSCAVDVEMAVYCTGGNASGQLGNGRHADTDTLGRTILGPGRARAVHTDARNHGLHVRWSPPRHTGAAPVQSYLVLAARGTEIADGSCATRGALACTVDELINGRRYAALVATVTLGGLSYGSYAYGTPAAAGLPITGPGGVLILGLMMLSTGVAVRVLSRRRVAVQRSRGVDDRGAV